MQNLDELRLLLLQEVDLWILTQLQSVDETRVLHKASTVEGLDLESSLAAPSVPLQPEPPTFHVVKDELGVVTPGHFLGREKEVLIIRVSQYFFQVFHKLATLQPASNVPLNVHGVRSALIEIHLEIVA